MKTSWKKMIALAFVLIFTVSCFTMTASAADSDITGEVNDITLKIVQFLFGENAVVDGNLDLGAVAHVLYYKDSPLILKTLDVIYVVFWKVLMFILNLFIK